MPVLLEKREAGRHCALCGLGTSGEGPLEEWKSADVIVVFFDIA